MPTSTTYSYITPENPQTNLRVLRFMAIKNRLASNSWMGYILSFSARIAYALLCFLTFPFSRIHPQFTSTQKKTRKHIHKQAMQTQHDENTLSHRTNVILVRAKFFVRLSLSLGCLLLTLCRCFCCNSKIPKFVCRKYPDVTFRDAPVFWGGNDSLCIYCVACCLLCIEFKPHGIIRFAVWWQHRHKRTVNSGILKFCLALYES